MGLSRPSGRLLALFWLPLLLLAIGLGLTWHNATTAANSVQAQTEQMLAVRHRALATLLKDQLDVLLESSRRVIASPLRDGSDFRQRARALMERHAMLQSVELIRQVPHDLRLQTEARIAGEQLEGGLFHHWEQDPATEPADSQANYLIVHWSHTRDGIGERGVAMGLLATSVPHWRQPLATARQQQTVATTSVRTVPLNGGSNQLVRLFLPVSANELLSVSFSPDRWLGSLYGSYYDPDIQLTVHDLSHHSKTPLYQHRVDNGPLSDQVLRTEVAIGDRYWMVATEPTLALFSEASAGLRRQLWLSGLAFALSAALLLCWPILRNRQLRSELERYQSQYQQLEQRFANLDVEKTILHQALDESGQRTRDLVSLAGGFVAELDEHLRIGFISDQVSDLLDRPPSEMANRPFDELIAPHYRENFLATLKAAREDRHVERIDLELQLDDRSPLPVSLRLKAQTDPVHGCVGYRLSALPRH
ncbi:MAG: CHASE domain-containing protein [Marinobacter sp.]|uniref:CHASE domain-containing protein n=1 Tax=Marinobacter sp. TaxID=50741 RepID=UPI00299DA0C5|nr:CHASE domain-containing protein [Marinobacter sp.]MDX1756934.1 CHASE domain-containing protein [Marinobacter sp.]